MLLFYGGSPGLWLVESDQMEPIARKEFAINTSFILFFFLLAHVGRNFSNPPTSAATSAASPRKDRGQVSF
jgi:hypothetical protein